MADMYNTLVLFGATGDLSFRYLLPSAALLMQEGLLPDNFQVIGLSRQDNDTERFRRDAGAELEEDRALQPQTIEQFVRRLSYAKADASDDAALKEALKGVDDPAVAYLALPPVVYEPAIEAVARVFPEGSRIVVEKPFGEGLESAQRLNALLHEHFPEEHVFRIDHFLGLAAVQAIPGIRFANRPFEATWNRDHIERVDITWDEHVALEGRAGYYDGMGALRDMVQNHLLEVLAAIAQELPASGDRDAFRESKCRLLNAIRPLKEEDVPQRVVRARYGQGEINGHRVPAYVDEEGVDPGHESETFVAMVLYVDNDRWRDVPFVIRTGKAQGAARQEAKVTYRQGSLASRSGFESIPGSALRIELEPPRLHFANTISTSRSLESPAAVTMSSDIPAGLPAYARVLLEILEGGQSLSVRDDEAEQLWRIVEPVIAAWEGGEPPLLEYPAGSDGPPLDSLRIE
jgi:glucose-6-phosphate 1-dehydrogenase